MYHYPMFDKLTSPRMPSSPAVQRFTAPEQYKNNVAIKAKTEFQTESNNVMKVQIPSGVSNGMSQSINQQQRTQHSIDFDRQKLKQTNSVLEPSIKQQPQQQPVYKTGSFIEQNIQQMKSKPQNSDILQIMLKYKSQRFTISFDISVETTTTLFQRSFEHIYKWEQSQSNPLKSDIVQELQSIQHFQTLEQDRNLSIDYYLSLENRPLSVFKGYQQQVVLIPFSGVKQKSNQVTLEDFLFFKCIGVGGFSRVYLVRKKDTGTFYALKIVDKRFIIDNRKEIVIQNERDIMVSVDNPFLTKLYFSFETNFYLVFIMEYCQGGELFYHLRKLKRLTEDMAKFFFLQVCMAVNYLHMKGVVYRDIKPENILVDLDGYLQLSDFGLSKPNMSSDDIAYSFCGSPEYMAPEMLQKSGHNYMVDCYCLGALLYEFITGLPPFYSRNVDQIYNSILSDEIKFPTSCKASPDMRDLIRKLLNKEPASRIGRNNGIKDILNHRWLKYFVLVIQIKGILIQQAFQRKKLFRLISQKRYNIILMNKSFKREILNFRQSQKRTQAEKNWQLEIEFIFQRMLISIQFSKIFIIADKKYYTKTRSGQKIYSKEISMLTHQYKEIYMRRIYPFQICSLKQKPLHKVQFLQHKFIEMQQYISPRVQAQQYDNQTKDLFSSGKMKSFKSDSDLRKILTVEGKSSHEVRMKTETDNNNIYQQFKQRNQK